MLLLCISFALVWSFYMGSGVFTTMARKRAARAAAKARGQSTPASPASLTGDTPDCPPGSDGAGTGMELGPMPSSEPTDTADAAVLVHGGGGEGKELSTLTASEPCAASGPTHSPSISTASSAAGVSAAAAGGAAGTASATTALPLPGQLGEARGPSHGDPPVQLLAFTDNPLRMAQAARKALAVKRLGTLPRRVTRQLPDS